MRTTEYGLTTVIRRIFAEIREAGQAVRPRGPVGPNTTFSARDIEIRRLRSNIACVRRVLAEQMIQDGRSTNEMAEAMLVAVSTAKNYRGRKHHATEEDRETVRAMDV